MANENISSLVKWLEANSDLLGSIMSVLLVPVAYGFKRIFSKGKLKHEDEAVATTKNTLTNNVTVNVDSSAKKMNSSSQDDQSFSVDDDLKLNTHVLFIDDEKFPVINILKNAGWVNTSRVRTVKSVNDAAIKNAHIIFVDINGVATDLFPNDHGLGLVVALKKKYGKSKKVAIYSAETSGNRFHEAFRLRDDQLNKNADSYEFQSTAEQLAIQLRKGE